MSCYWALDRELSLLLTVLGEPLANVTNTKYLGVFVDNHLKWEVHISHPKKSIWSKIACLRRLLRHIVLPLYKIYIMPILDYCDCVWSSAGITLLKPLDSLHNRFLKSILSSSEILPSLCLINRRKYHIIIQSFKIVKGLCPSYLSNSLSFSSTITGRISKNKYLVFVPSMGRNSFYFRAVYIYL